MRLRLDQEQEDLMNIQTGAIKRGRKFKEVLEGARQVFMADGFERASVDAIASVAGVSKATLYSYFPDKRTLFTEVVRSECHCQADRAMATIDQTAPAKEILCIAARHMIGFYLSDFGQRMFRICVSEADRFPELGQEFYNSGPLVANQALKTYFDKAIRRGELRMDDRELAAFQFAELCKAYIFNRILFGVQTTFSEAEVDRIINGAVDVFLARYGT